VPRVSLSEQRARQAAQAAARLVRRSSHTATESLVSVARELDLVALELERTPKRLAHGSLVVDDENLHPRIVRARPGQATGVLATS